MRLRVDVLGNWWVFESLCVSYPLRLWAVCVSAYPLQSAKPSLQAPNAQVCFLHVCAPVRFCTYKPQGL